MFDQGSCEPWILAVAAICNFPYTEGRTNPRWLQKDALTRSSEPNTFSVSSFHQSLWHRHMCSDPARQLTQATDTHWQRLQADFPTSEFIPSPIRAPPTPTPHPLGNSSMALGLQFTQQFRKQHFFCSPNEMHLTAPVFIPGVSDCTFHVKCPLPLTSRALRTAPSPSSWQHQRWAAHPAQHRYPTNRYWMNQWHLKAPDCHKVSWSQFFPAVIFINHPDSFIEGQLWAR